MRRTWLAVLALVGAGLGAPGSHADPGPGFFTSPNVTWVANVPLDAPAIGARVIQVGAQRRLYVSGTHGMSIYDVTNPALPVPLGSLAVPHFENESFAVSDDGSVAFLTSDPGFGQPPLTYVVDTSIVAAPHVVSVIPDGSHTATCSDAKCSYLYANYGWIYDVRERANPRLVTDDGPGATHYASRDAAGYLWDNHRVIDPRRDPTHPKVWVVGTGGWHGNLRPNADKYRPRRRGDTSRTLRPGELVIGSDETWLTPGTCDYNSAGISTWSVAGFERGAKARKIGTVKPANGTWSDGAPPADVVGCSAHWFDYRKGMVAAGWYDHGVRFFSVNEKTGAIAEVGWFQPVYSLTWGAYWVDDTYVYSIDAVRGIDILRFDRTAKPAPAGRLATSWHATLFQADPIAEREQWVCRQVARRAAARG